MSDIGKPERATQNRVIALFRDELGYRYLGDWADRDGNSNIEEGLLTAYLTRNGSTPEQISRVLYRLRSEADNYSRSLYGNNQAVYNLLRYGRSRLERSLRPSTSSIGRSPRRTTLPLRERLRFGAAKSDGLTSCSM
jgi:hypothetical protein